MEAASSLHDPDAHATLWDAAPMRAAILSTYPPRACGIGTFSFDVHSALLDVSGVEDVRPIAVVDEPSSPQRPELLATVCQGMRTVRFRAPRPR